jgi:hypothetical protein
MEGLITRKNWFSSQFRLLLEEIKVLGSNYNFEELIWSNHGLNCIIIEVWWSIRDLIETIQNQGLNQKIKELDYKITKTSKDKIRNIHFELANGVVSSTTVDHLLHPQRFRLRMSAINGAISATKTADC